MGGPCDCVMGKHPSLSPKTADSAHSHRICCYLLPLLLWRLQLMLQVLGNGGLGCGRSRTGGSRSTPVDFNRSRGENKGAGTNRSPTDVPKGTSTSDLVLERPRSKGLNMSERSKGLNCFFPDFSTFSLGTSFLLLPL